MNRPIVSRRKSFGRYLKEGLREEAYAWYSLIRENLAWFLLLLCGVAVLLAVARPLPPAKVYLAAGQPGSSYWLLAEKLASYFAQHGVALEIVPTEGSNTSLQELVDKNSDVTTALLLGGSAKKGDFPQLVSLGSLQYSPLWLFYRGPEFKGDDAIRHFSERRIAIGLPGSGTQNILKKVLELRGVTLKQGENFLELPHAEAANRLVDGSIDAMCIVDSMDSPIIQKLLASPEVRIFSFGLVPAYVKQLPFLDVVTIPRGSLDLKTIYPEQDIHMVASTMMLLVEKDTHPAIQLMFLLAANQVRDDRDQFFAKPEFFPAYVDHSIPLSPVAKRFYEHGPPVLLPWLPIWLANFVDRMWLSILAAIAIGYPLLRTAPSYRRFRSSLLIGSAYEELKRIEDDLSRADDTEGLDDLSNRLSQLESEISATWIASDNMGSYYSLKSALNLVVAKTAARRDGVEDSPASG